MWTEPPPPPAYIAPEPAIAEEIESIRQDLAEIRDERNRFYIDEIRRMEIERVVTDVIVDSRERSFGSGRPWNEIASEEVDP